MTKKSTLIGIAIIGFWLVTMAALLQREVLPNFLRPKPPAAALQDYDRWYGVFVEPDSRVGVIHVTSTGMTRDGVSGTELQLEADLTLNLLEVATELSGEASVWTPHGGGAIEFSGHLTSGQHRFAASGTVDDGVLDGAIETGAESFPVEWPVGELGTTTALFSTGGALPALDVGESTQLPAFDPLTMRLGEATLTSIGHERVHIGDDEVQAAVYETTLSGITSRVWVDEHGDIVQAQTPYGFTLRRVSAEEALMPGDPASTADALAMAAIVPTGEAPVRGARRMVAKLDGIDSFEMIPNDTHQVLDEHGVLTITMPAAPEVTPSAVADAGEIAEALAADPLIPTGNPTIVAQATRIVDGANDDWERAVRLYAWVYENIDKVPVPAIPSALDVLQTREGDCNEHTVLFAAFARSLGIPTRVAVGVVWSDELKAFYYHAWPEVYVGRWIPMDPTLGQRIADATHIKLLEGDIQRWPRLIAFLGRMRIHVLEIE